jgi:hypothetical protein
MGGIVALQNELQRSCLMAASLLIVQQVRAAPNAGIAAAPASVSLLLCR